MPISSQSQSERKGKTPVLCINMDFHYRLRKGFERALDFNPEKLGLKDKLGLKLNNEVNFHVWLSFYKTIFLIIRN